MPTRKKAVLMKIGRYKNQYDIYYHTGNGKLYAKKGSQWFAVIKKRKKTATKRKAVKRRKKVVRRKKR